MDGAREEGEEGQQRWVRGPLLGKGGSGSVHMAYFPERSGAFRDFPAVAAVKSGLEERSTEDYLKSERDSLKRMSDCPYIVKYLGDEVTVTSEGKQRLNVFMEYASGGTLKDLVKERKGLPESQVRLFTKHILGGLRRVHDEGLVHRDLKLANVLLFGGGEGEDREIVAKVADFGLTRLAIDSGPQVIVGTNNYWDPEMMRYKIQSPASDIWALGCIVFGMFTGKLPMEFFPTPLPGSNTAEAADFVNQCLTAKRTNRPTAAQLLGHPFICGDDLPPPPQSECNHQ